MRNFINSTIVLLFALFGFGAASAQCPSGDPNVFGTNEWRVYAYTNNTFTNYAGVYTHSVLSFDTRSLWGISSNPGAAAGYLGCAVPNDGHGFIYKRQGFPTGVYNLDIPTHDDGVTVLVNGVQVYQNLGCCAARNDIWTGTLNASSTVEYRIAEMGGQSIGALDFTLEPAPAALIGGSIATIANLQYCGSTPANIALTSSVAGSSGCTFAYQWQSSVGCTGTWSAISGATSATYTIPAGVSTTTCYRRMASDACGRVEYSNTITITVYATPPGDPAQFGSSSWNAYVYNSNTLFTNYSGFYTATGLNFDSRLQWGVASNPGLASNYQGCPLSGNDNFSVVYKRQGFTAGTYQLDIPTHDDQVYVLVNGVEVYQNLGWGGPRTNIWTGQLDGTSTVEYRFREAGGEAAGSLSFTLLPTPAPLVGGTIATTATLQYCGPTPGNIALTSSVAGSSGCTFAYQWQRSVGCTGTWSAISGATSATYTIPAGVSTTTCYRRMVTDACGRVEYSNTITITVYATPPGDPAQFGSSAWNAYVYNSNTLFTNYSGFYTASGLNFDSRSQWGLTSNPGLASNYQGCPLSGNDNFSVVYKRQGFTAGTYQLDIPLHDDQVYVLVNGVEVYQNLGWGGPRTNIWTGPLDGTSTLEYRFREGGGDAAGSLNFTLIPTPAALIGGTIATTATLQYCGPTPATIALTSSVAASSGCTFAYQWQSSLGCSGTWSAISGATSAAYTIPAGLSATNCYRRMVTDACGRVEYSNTITLTVYATPPGDPAQFGNSAWNVYVYNSNNLFTNYSGFYTASGLNFDSRLQWGVTGNPGQASTYLGCPIGNDNFSFIYKRQGFPSGDYQLDIPNHDDQVYVLVNGILVFENLGCCAARTNIWTGTLGASSTVEYRIREGGGESAGALSFTLIPSPAAITGGTIATNRTLCEAAIPNQITSTTAATSGCTLVGYQWQSSVGCTGTWANISGATALTYTPNPLSATTCFRRVAMDACNRTAFSNTITYTINPLPATPGAISGPASVCRPNNSVNYSIAALSGASTYTWTTPTGVNITAGATTISPTFNFTATAASGNVTVRGVSAAGCQGPIASISVVVNPGVPVFSGSITGLTTVCPNSTGLTYTSPAATNPGTYIWTLPSGFSATAPGNTQSIAVATNGSPAAGNITVRASNACGLSTNTLSLAITIQTAVPAVTVGSNTPVLPTNTISLTATTISGASYAWTGPNGFSTTIQNPSVANAAPINGGLYSLTVSNGSCTPANASVYVVVADVYRSRASGNFDAAATWQVSHDLTVWQNALVPPSTLSSSVLVTTPHSVTINANTTQNSVLIQSGSLLESPGQTLTVLQSFGNQGGLFVANGGTVDLAGDAQTVSGTVPIIFHNLSASNTGTKSVQGTIGVSNTFTLTGSAIFDADGADNAQTFILTSNATRTGRIASLANPNNFQGRITMERYFQALRRVRYVSSPVVGGTVNMLRQNTLIVGPVAGGFDAPNVSATSIKWYNESLAGAVTIGWRNFTSAATVLNPGQGYQLFVPGTRTTVFPNAEATTLRLTGEPNKGTVALNVTYSAAGQQGWSFVGNPYPSQVDWNAASGWNKSNVDNAIYFWDPTVGSSGAYASYVDGVSSDGRSNPNVIPSFQGFFVKANGAAPSLTINENAKVASTHTSNFRTTQAAVPLVRVSLTSATAKDFAVVCFRENVGLGFDSEADALKLKVAELNIGVVAEDAKVLSIQSIADTTYAFSLPIEITSNKTGLHTITIEHTDLEDVYLIDAFTTDTIEAYLGMTHTIDITSDTNTFGKNRLSLYRGAKTKEPIVITGLLVNGASSSGFSLFPNPNAGQVMELRGTSIQSLRLYDAAGALIETQNTSFDGQGTYRYQPSTALQAGVYVIEVQDLNGNQYTQRFVVE